MMTQKLIDIGPSRMACGGEGVIWASRSSGAYFIWVFGNPLVARTPGRREFKLAKTNLEYTTRPNGS